MYFCWLLLATSCKHCFKAPTSCRLRRLLWKARTSNPWWCLDSALAADAACGWQPKLDRFDRLKTVAAGIREPLKASGASGGLQPKKQTYNLDEILELLDNVYHCASVCNIYSDNSHILRFFLNMFWRHCGCKMLQVWPRSIQQERPTRTRRDR
jgi:hypothetical protein